MSYTIGIDLGGTTMTAGLVNEDYEIVGKITWATRLPRPAEDLEKAMADLCREVAKQNGVDFSEVRYVGIGTPGSVNFTTGFVGYNTNFNYYDWNLGTDLEAARCVFEVDGTPVEKNVLHPLGLLATTAQGTLTVAQDDRSDPESDWSMAARWVEWFWNQPLRKGGRRYYDNCLYLFALLALSGNYRIWK